MAKYFIVTFTSNAKVMYVYSHVCMVFAVIQQLYNNRYTQLLIPYYTDNVNANLRLDNTIVNAQVS